MRLTCLYAVLGFVFLVSPANADHHNGYQELSDILIKVYESNPTLMAAREELKETKELYPQARAGWLPSVTGETSIYASDIDNSNFGGADGATTKDLSLSVDQPIWRGGRTFAETKRAKELIHAGEAVLREAEQDIFLETVTVYMNVLRDKELQELRRQNEGILMRELRAAWERMDIGDITDTDVQQAKARLSRAKSEHIEAKKESEISHAEFEQVTGIKPPDKLMVPYMKLGIPPTLGEMFTMAENRNAALSIAKFEQSASEHNADAVFRELLPQVSAFASFNQQYDPQPGIVEDSRNQTVGLRASIALYQGGATRSRHREARHTAKRRAYEIQETRRRVKQEVISNWRSYEAAKAQTETRKEEIEAAEKALKGVREEARIGQRTVLDILDADQEVIDAKISLSKARRNETVAMFALAASLGLLDTGLLQSVSR